MAVNAAGCGDFYFFFADWTSTSFSIGIGVSHHVVLGKVDRENLNALRNADAGIVYIRSGPDVSS